MTIKPQNIQHFYVMERGLPDLHKMNIAVMKAFFERFQPRVMSWRDYKYFENDGFRINLLSELDKVNREENGNRLKKFLDTCKRILDIYAPWILWIFCILWIRPYVRK